MASTADSQTVKALFKQAGTHGHFNKQVRAYIDSNDATTTPQNLTTLVNGYAEAILAKITSAFEERNYISKAKRQYSDAKIRTADYIDSFIFELGEAIDKTDCNNLLSAIYPNCNNYTAYIQNFRATLREATNLCETTINNELYGANSSEPPPRKLTNEFAKKYANTLLTQSKLADALTNTLEHYSYHSSKTTTPTSFDLTSHRFWTELTTQFGQCLLQLNTHTDFTKANTNAHRNRLLLKHAQEELGNCITSTTQETMQLLLEEWFPKMPEISDGLIKDCKESLSAAATKSLNAFAKKKLLGKEVDDGASNRSSRDEDEEEVLPSAPLPYISTPSSSNGLTITARVLAAIEEQTGSRTR